MEGTVQATNAIRSECSEEDEGGKEKGVSILVRLREIGEEENGASKPMYQPTDVVRESPRLVTT